MGAEQSFAVMVQVVSTLIYLEDERLKLQPDPKDRLD